MSGDEPAYGGVSIRDFLLVCASPAESPGDHVIPLVGGVGKTATTLSLYSHLRSNPGFRAVLLFGFAGAFPDRHRDSPGPLRRGELCVVGSDRFGDEGVETPSGFQDFGAPTWGAGQRLSDTGPFPANPRMAQQVAALLSVPIVRGVTVSTCSGTEATSERMARRSGADVETMEGAAAAYVCRQLELPMLHVRAISNWTGDRTRGDWNRGAALDALHRAVNKLFARS